MSEETDILQEFLQVQINNLDERLCQLELRPCTIKNDDLVQELRDEIEVLNARHVSLQQELGRVSRNEGRLRRQLDKLVGHLRWSNHNGGAAYIVEGVGIGEIRQFLESVK